MSDIIDLHAKKRMAPHTIEWSAAEYEMRERSPYWFFAVSGISLAFILFGIFTRNYFFIAFIALACIVTFLYTKKAPQMIRCAVTRDGIFINHRRHEFSRLKSFCIFERPDFHALSLETDKALSPFLHVPLGHIDIQKLKNVLSQYLPEEDHKEFISDQIARNIGL